MIRAALAPILDEGLWGFFVFASAISVIALFAAAFQDHVPGTDESQQMAPRATEPVRLPGLTARKAARPE